MVNLPLGIGKGICTPAMIPYKLLVTAFILKLDVKFNFNIIKDQNYSHKST
jgi:hypothetical protein